MSRNPDGDQEQSVRFADLPVPALAALEQGDLELAEARAGLRLGEHFVSDRARWLWRVRLNQIVEDPDNTHWMTRVLATDPADTVLGHGGFHGPPDAQGMVEVGYFVVPEHRRRGVARAMLRELVRRAEAAQDARIVRACISPRNAPSLATIAGFGFAKVGEQWDDEDGLEIIHELRLT